MFTLWPAFFVSLWCVPMQRGYSPMRKGYFLTQKGYFPMQKGYFPTQNVCYYLKLRWLSGL